MEAWIRRHDIFVTLVPVANVSLIEASYRFLGWPVSQ